MIASADNHKTDTLVNCALMEKDKIQLTRRDVFQLQLVTLEIKLLALEMPKTATNADHAPFQRSQVKTDNLATDQDQNADVPKNTH